MWNQNDGGLRVEKYLICSDIDGTLMSNHQEISQNTLNLIEQLQQQGHLFYVATGRMFLSAFAVAKQISEKTGVIASNGGIYCHEDKLVEHIMDLESSKLTYEIAMKYQLPLFFFSKDAIYYSLVLPGYFKDEGDQGRVDSGQQKSYYKIKNSNDILKYGSSFLNGIIISDDQLDNLKYAKKELVQVAQLTVTSSYYNNIEISPKGISKAVAIKDLQAKHDVPPERTIVFGDGGNDIEMFKMAKISVAMANAGNEVKEASNYETKSNNDEGVYYFLKQYFNKEGNEYDRK